jgi:nitrate/nitrite transporter NarK
VKRKLNPGTFIAMALMGWLFWQFIGWWAIPLIALSFIMYLVMYDYEKQKSNAKKMRRELRREQRMGNRAALADEYVRRHPDKA